MKTVAVIFGGRSAEHDVSIVTAIASIIKPLQLTKQYKIEPIYIAKNGAWYWDEKLKDIELYSSGKIDDFIHKNQPASVQFDGGMTLIKSSGIAGRKTIRKIDIVFPAMHGTYGEDGSLMGLLDLAAVPYVGCGLNASAVAMDKVLSREVAKANDILVPSYEYFYSDMYARKPVEIIKTIESRLHYPLFVKPSRLGSSIGITKVSDRRELQNAIEVAAHYDNKIIVEEAVSNLIELTLPIIGNRELKTALLERPMTTPEDYFDFDTKYMQGGKKGGGKKGGGVKGSQGYSEIPANIPKDLYDMAEKLATKAYKVVECEGIARVDLLVDEKAKKVYFNEINPLPGGLYSHNWKKAGVSNVDLVESLIRLALDRFDRRQKLATTFSTNYLKQF